MKNAVLTFLVLMALLGLGTIFLVEKFAGEQILPRSIQGISVDELTRSYERTRRAIQRWWNKAASKASGLGEAASPSAQDGSSTEREIIKWQDAQGVWHYEHGAPPGESGSPAPPP